jgi:hypothetical protein
MDELLTQTKLTFLHRDWKRISVIKLFTSERKPETKILRDNVRKKIRFGRNLHQ